MTQLWLLGGAGDVGAQLAKLLSDMGFADVVVVSRNGAKAQQVLIDKNISAQLRVMNVSNPDLLDDIPPDSIIVNFVESLSPDTAGRHCARGGSFVETSASINYLEAIRALNTKEKGTLVLGAGMAPGLTNVMARRLIDVPVAPEYVQIVIEIGMGRHHGEAANEWTIREWSRSYSITRAGRTTSHKPFSVPMSFKFLDEDRTSTAYNFGFSDQQLLADDFPNIQVETYLLFDPQFVSRLMYWAKYAGITPPKFLGASNIAKWFRKLPTMGTNQSRILVRALNAKGRTVNQMQMTSRNQSEVTAVVLQSTIRNILSRPKSGTVTLDEFVDFDSLLADLVEQLPGTSLIEP